MCNKKPETIVSALNNIGGSSELKRISVVFTVAQDESGTVTLQKRVIGDNS